MEKTAVKDWFRQNFKRFKDRKSLLDAAEKEFGGSRKKLSNHMYDIGTIPAYCFCGRKSKIRIFVEENIDRYEDRRELIEACIKAMKCTKTTAWREVKTVGGDKFANVSDKKKKVDVKFETIKLDDIKRVFSVSTRVLDVINKLPKGELVKDFIMREKLIISLRRWKEVCRDEKLSAYHVKVPNVGRVWGSKEDIKTLRMSM